MIRFFVLIFFSLSVFAAENDPLSQFSFVNGCRIYDSKIKLLKSFPGERCLFLENGDFISSTATRVSYYAKNLEVKWTFENVFFHHQMNLSHDKKHILLLGSEVLVEKEEKVRSDLFIVLGLDGKLFKQMPFLQLIDKKSSDLSRINVPDKFLKPSGSTAEVSHFNSFHEIPPLTPSGQKVKGIGAARYIVNSLELGIYFLDEELKLVSHLKYADSFQHFVHDVQVLPSGRLLLFNNNNSAAKTWKRRFSSIDEFDLQKNKITFQVTAQPREFFYSRICGGVQQLTPDLLVISHNLSGVFVYSKKQKKIVFSSDELHQGPGGVPAGAQEIKLFDLTSFLKNQF
jgi:hypothetical protein